MTCQVVGLPALLHTAFVIPAAVLHTTFVILTVVLHTAFCHAFVGRSLYSANDQIWRPQMAGREEAEPKGDPATGRKTGGSKERSGAQVFVADGLGGLREIDDLRFDDGTWPFDFVIASGDADAWIAQLHAEVEYREWNASSFSQLHAAESSGTITIHTASGASPPSVEIVYERLRDEGLHVRVRPGGHPPLLESEVRQLLARVGQRLTAGETDHNHRRELLGYEGMAWRGELWLSRDLRLGPPSRFPAPLLGPQILVIDAMVEGIGTRGVSSNFGTLVHELTIFLSFVLGIHTWPVRWRQDWVPELDESGRITDCTVRSVGYSELALPSSFPEFGTAPPIERRDVERPGLGPVGISPDMSEEWVPSDIEELWATFAKLAKEKRSQLMRAGNAYRIARSMWPDQRTAYATFLVISCEALKPVGKRFNKMNIYDVVETVLGGEAAEGLRQSSVRPQGVRNDHVHRGELLADELRPMLTSDYFADPSFDEMLRDLLSTTRTCLIEWLRQSD